MQADPTINLAEKDVSTFRDLLDAVLEIGREPQRIMESLSEALLRGNAPEALERGRELTGLPTNRSVDTSPSTSAGS